MNRRNFLQQFVIHLLLLLFGIIMVLPFFWMITTSLKTPLEALRFPPTFIPKIFQFQNYPMVFKEVPLLRYFLNTVFITVLVVLGILITSLFSAYAFARFRFRGREILFLLFLALMMIPLPVYLVPSYIILYRLGMIDTYWAMIIPWTVSIFSIFLLRQHIKTLPRDLFDAAKIDGAGHLKILFNIVIPLSKPPLVALTVFNTIGTWNSFFWPLIVTHRDSIRPIQVGLAYFALEQSTNYPLLMAASTLTILPLIILFFFAQRQIIESYIRSGLKE